MNRFFRTYSLLSAAAFLCLGVLAFSSNEEEFLYTVNKLLPIIEESSQESQTFISKKGVFITDSLDLLFPLEDQPNYYQEPGNENPFNLPNPSIIDHHVEYDPANNEYIITDSIGGSLYRYPTYLSLEQYMQYEQEQALQNYWMNQAQGGTAGGALGGGTGGLGGLIENTGDQILGKLNLPKLPEKASDIFGGDLIDIRPSGSVVLDFYFSKEKNQNPNFSAFQRNQPLQFGFDMDIPTFNLNANIGEKLKMNMDYSTLQTFNFNQQIKLEYTGDEDQIIQRLEAGNTAFQVPTTLIPSATNLFGVQAKLKFGRLTMTHVLAQQKSSQQAFQIDNGGRTQNFTIDVSDYDANNNFLLAHHFRENFNSSMALLPNILPEDNITRLEVWVTNRVLTNPELRDIVALSDLGEARLENLNNPIVYDSAIPADIGPDNNNNTLRNVIGNPAESDPDAAVSLLGAQGLNVNSDYVQFEGRKLQPNEYSFDPGLGMIILNYRLNDADVLAVSYEYADKNGVYRQVGEFSNEKSPGLDSLSTAINPSANLNSSKRVVFMKMLKTRGNRPELPIWDLMMKNIYRIPGAYRLEQNALRLDVFYRNPGIGLSRYLPDDAPESIRGEILLRLLNLDRLNMQRDPCPDGMFDYLENYTVLPNTGRLVFPVLEPFGSNMHNKLTAAGASQSVAEKYTYSSLYETTPAASLQFPEQNRYQIMGEFKSSVTNQYSINSFNLQPGDVIVTAGGKPLVENVDYRIDYAAGRLTLLNESYLLSGIPIKIQYRDNSSLGFNQKGFLGSRLDYWINNNFTLGATFVRLSERPFTQKTNFGEDPISNKMVGFDFKYFHETPAITRALDKLPLYSTKEPSSISINGEMAAFFPGHSRALGDKGFVFIDDFEGSRSNNSLEFPINSWIMASTPQTSQFPESSLLNDWAYGFNRASISLYKIDLRNYSIGTANHAITNATRQIRATEIFPARQNIVGQNNLPTFDIYFDPTQRGPYNFDTQPTVYSAGINTDGSLKNPKSRWGGFARKIDNVTDFEDANIRYIEFWMMDPYYQSNEENPGEMYLQIGNIAEDILKDGRKFFENGLPGIGQVGNVDETIWSRIPNNQIISNYFDTNEANRVAQDVGFDGVNDELEQVKFEDYLNNLNAIVTSDVKEEIIKDPANDNFRSFISPDNSADVPIYERYRRWNKPQGNSPILQADDQTAAATALPDMEDLNLDNTLEKNEEFFEYKLKLHSDMDRNDPFIADIREGQVETDDNISVPYRWLKFKIPVEEYSDRKGAIQNFRNIQFMRLVLTQFEKPVVLRLADFNLVRNIWRPYTSDIIQPGLYMPDDNGGETVFNVTTVNIEENGNRAPVPYVIPPGVQREIVNTQGQPLAQNEQSISLEVCGLADGHAKAVFKNPDPMLDMRFYKRLQCWISAQNLNVDEFFSENLHDYDVSAFIRIGNDFTQNFYEYEKPLVITDDLDLLQSLLETYNNTSLDNPTRDAALEQIANIVWPSENRFDIEIQRLVNAKLDRNYKRIEAPDYTKPYTVAYDTLVNDGAKITVVGVPDLGRAPVIMLGVRNPKSSTFNLNNDGKSKCAEVWFNELRLYDFDESPAIGALARMDLKLADLGTLTVSGDMHTSGFGNLQQKINERFRDNFYKSDVIGNFNMDKFLPAGSGIRIPMLVGWSEAVSNPEYDPYETDLKLKDKIALTRSTEGDAAAKAVKKNAQDYESIKSINFANVRKERGNGAKMRAYDIENWNTTYSYTIIDRRDPIVESEEEKRHFFSLGYNYSTRPKYITPLGKIKSPGGYLNLLKEFNVNLIPSSLTFINDLTRRTIQTQLRTIRIPGQVIEGDFHIDPTYNKDFTWERKYGYRHDLTKSLNLDFSAMNKSRIDEPCGPIVRDQLWNNMKTGGRNLNYKQVANVSYNLPLDKFPLTDWTQTKLKYSAGFDWITGPLPPRDAAGQEVDSLDTKHIIQNDKNWTIDGELNLKKLYTKIPYLKKVDNYKPVSKTTKDRQKEKDKEKEKEKQKDAAITGQEMAKENKNKASQGLSLAERLFVQPLLSIKRVSLTYNNKKGTRIPGFNFRNQYLGQNFDEKAPGFDFIFGTQPDSTWLENAAAKGWITNNPRLNNQVIQKREKSLSGKATLEPWKDVKIDVNLTQTSGYTHNERFKANESGQFIHQAKMDVGSYSVSFLPLRSLFEKIDTQFISETFTRMQAYRPIISERLGVLNDANSNGPFIYYPAPGDTIPPVELADYAQGYGPYSQEVLIPAFLAAYTKTDPGKVKLNPTKIIPRPNWKLTYNGLSKMDFFKKYFSNISLSHGYNSTLNVNRFQTNPDFRGTYDNNYNYPEIVDTLNGNFYNRFTMNDIVISEQFAPLIGIDVAMKNGFTGKFQMKKTRNLNLNFSLPQLVEQRSTEFTFGSGYRLTGMSLPIKLGKKTLNLENEMNFKFDFSIRDNVTINHKFDALPEVTTGSKTITTSPSVNYVINNKLKAEIYYTRERVKPKTSAFYPRITNRGGLRLTFTLTQ